MITSKAIDLISTFSEDEFRRFGLFVRSPYFNNEKVQVVFYDKLKKYHPLFNQKGFEKEKLYSALYPGKKYNDGVMRNILSNTLELAKKFLVTERSLSDKEGFNLELMEELGNRKQVKLFEKADEELVKLLEQSAVKDDEYFNSRFLQESRRRKAAKRLMSKFHFTDGNLQAMVDNLTKSFVISILRLNAFLANTNKSMLKYHYDPFLMKEIESYLENNKDTFGDLIYVRYYFNTLKLAETEDEKHFFELKKILEVNFDELKDSDKSDIYSILTNFCYFKINKGELRFRKEQFELSREHISRGYYTGEKGYLSHIQYINTTVIGLDAGEHDWVHDFITKYKEELDSVNKENSYNFCSALYYYHKKEYNRSLDLAAKVKTDDLSYKHQLKSLYLKIYFDLNETEPFYNHIDSYRHFLTNQKNIPENTRDIIGKYVGYSKKLFDIKNNLSERDFDLHKMKVSIEENKSMINKQWLLDRINEIEKNTTGTSQYPL